MITMEELRTGFMAAERVDLRLAVRDALEQGFHRDVPPDEEEEVNLVLQSREEAEKKTKTVAEAVRCFWQRLLSGSTSAPETRSS